MDNRKNSAVKVLGKGLAALETLGRLGKASAAEVASHIGVPRPTAHRLLETLCELGYVKRSGPREGYSLGLAVRALAQGCRDDDWIVEIAEPVLSRLYEKVVWPTDIATYQNGSMIIRATTHRRSPLSLERISSNRPISMLNSATGLAYLAFSGEIERRVIIESLDFSPAPDGKRWHPELLSSELLAVRERGYGVRIRGSQPKTSSIAVPIIAGEQVVGCINLNWIDSAADQQSIVQQHLKDLQSAAKEIGQRYLEAKRQPDMPPAATGQVSVRRRASVNGKTDGLPTD